MCLSLTSITKLFLWGVSLAARGTELHGMENGIENVPRCGGGGARRPWEPEVGYLEDL